MNSKIKRSNMMTPIQNDSTSLISIVTETSVSVGLPRLCFPFDTVAHDVPLTEQQFLPEIDRSKSHQHCLEDATSNLLQSHLQRLSTPKSCEFDKLVTPSPVNFGVGSTISSWIKVIIKKKKILNPLF